MMLTVYRRRQVWEAARSSAAALQAAAVRSAAAAAAGGGEAGSGAASSGSSGSSSGGSSEPGQDHKEDVRQLRSVLNEFYKRGRAERKLRKAASGGSSGAAPAWQRRPQPGAPQTEGAAEGAGVQAALAQATGAPPLPPLGPGRLAEEEKRRVVPLPLSARARQTRLEESVRINKTVCRKFDDLDRQLVAGTLTPAERLAAGQACLDAVGATLHSVMDHVNMSTFFHRISRLVTHPAMAPVQQELDTSRVMPLLVQRFEGLLDRILRAKAWTGGTGGSGAAKGGSGGGGKGGGAPEPDLALSLRSLGTSFWALGNMQYPLAQEQLDKIAGVVMLKYGEVSPHHVSMLLLALNAYPRAAFSAKLLRVLLERCAYMPVEQFEARTLVNTLCAAAASGAVPSQAVMDRLCLAALAILPELDKGHLGSLSWSLGKLGSRIGPGQIHPAVLHAVAAAAWRAMDEMTANPLTNLLYGFGLLNFNPGTAFLDAAAARVLQLLPGMHANDVVNVAWSFARLDYSPDPERDMWAISTSRPPAGYSARWAPSGGAWAWQQPAAEAEAAPAAEREAGGWASPREQAAAAREQAAQAREQAVLGLAQRVAVQRARREAFSRLLVHAREATAAALARSPAVRPGAGEEEEPSGQAVTERSMADLVHFICTGQADRPRQPRVVHDATDMMMGLEEVIDSRTGVTQLRPYYSREQIFGLLLPLLPSWRRQQAAAEAAAEEQAAESAGQQLLSRIREVKGAAGAARQGDAQQAAAAAAGSDEMESLDAFISDQAAGAWQPAREGQQAGPGASGSEVVDSMLEDPELVDLEEAAAAAGGGGGGGGASASSSSSMAAGLALDLDAVQQEEEEEDMQQSEEEEEEGEGEESEGQGAGDGSAESLAQQLTRLRQEERQAFRRGLGVPAAHGAAQPAGLLSRLGRRSPEQVRREERRRQLEAAEQRQAERAAQKAAKAAAKAAAVGAGGAARGDAVGAAAADGSWRELGLSPEALQQHLLADPSRFAVPSAVRKRWQGAERLTLDDASAHVLRSSERLTGGEVSTMMWALATARHVHPPLFQTLLRRAEETSSSMSWRGIGIVLWSAAVTMQRPSRQLADRLVDRFLPQFQRHLDQRYDLHALCNVTWALAAFDYLNPERFSELLSYVPRDPKAYESINTAGWCQFFQCALHLEAKTGRHYSSFLPPELLPFAERAWGRRDHTTSRLQNKVADVLHSLGVPFAEEYSPRASFFSIDIAVMDGNTRLAVEVDGPQHFSSNAPHVPLASTCMRNALLESAGWRVISIPFNAWAQLAGLQEKQDYLRQHVLSQLPKPKR